MSSSARPGRRPRALPARATLPEHRRVALVLDGAAADADVVRWAADWGGRRVVDVDLLALVTERPHRTFAARAGSAAEALRAAGERLAVGEPSADVRDHLLTAGLGRSLPPFLVGRDLLVLGARGTRRRRRTVRVAQRTGVAVVLVPHPWAAVGASVVLAGAPRAAATALAFARREAAAAGQPLVLAPGAVLPVSASLVVVDGGSATPRAATAARLALDAGVPVAVVPRGR
ncbi:hypothetical protein CLV52_1787 [Amnibacterium kyonggiense]|uniref:Universal stress protein family protein n=1 Tax=Amnibacterium kyonggiense TaxID=595671 RepID=A0A4R7FKI1_9MICO|nr:hypothetical protein CLV52_1787 [Amnibacterium kyonggiense]